MNEPLVKRVRDAAWATWMVLAILAVWMTVAYFFWLAVLHYRMEWVRFLWGGRDLTWSEMQWITLWFFGGFKLGLFAVLAAAIWLTLFARRLRRAA